MITNGCAKLSCRIHIYRKRVFRPTEYSKDNEQPDEGRLLLSVYLYNLFFIRKSSKQMLLNM